MQPLYEEEQHRQKTWQECEQHIQEQRRTCMMLPSDCEWHWEQTIAEIKDTNHPRHAEYVPVFACECEYHKRAQEDEYEATETDQSHPHHGLTRCRVEGCGKCGKEDEPEEETYPESDNRNTANPQHRCLHWTFCYADDCWTHYMAKLETGWFPRAPRRRRQHLRAMTVRRTATTKKPDQWRKLKTLKTGLWTFNDESDDAFRKETDSPRNSCQQQVTKEIIQETCWITDKSQTLGNSRYML